MVWPSSFFCQPIRAGNPSFPKGKPSTSNPHNSLTISSQSCGMVKSGEKDIARDLPARR